MKSDNRREQGILVVDDEKNINRILSLMLRDLNYRVFSAANAIEALGLLEEHGEEILVVLLDLKMPKMDGLEMIKHLVNIHSIPVGIIMMTAHGSIGTLKDFLSAGSETVMPLDYVTKPFNNDEFVSEVNKAVRSVLRKRKTLLAASQSEIYTRLERSQAETHARLDRIENSIELMSNRQSGFLAQLGMDLVRAIVVAVALLLLLLFGFGDFVKSVLDKIV